MLPIIRFLSGNPNPLVRLGLIWMGALGVFTLQAGELRGTLRWEDGSPVQEGFITIVERTYLHERGGAIIEDSQGRFESFQVPDGTYILRIRIRLSTGLISEFYYGSEDGLDLSAATTVEIEGITEKDLIVPWQWAELTVPVQGGRPGGTTAFVTLFREGRPGMTLLLDDSQTVTWAGLLPGCYNLAWGYAPTPPGTAPSKQMVFLDGQPISPEMFQAVDLAPSLNPSVVPLDRQPIPLAVVDLEIPGDPGLVFKEIDLLGEGFRLTPGFKESKARLFLPPGEYRLWINYWYGSTLKEPSRHLILEPGSYQRLELERVELKNAGAITGWLEYPFLPNLPGDNSWYYILNAISVTSGRTVARIHAETAQTKPSRVPYELSSLPDGDYLLKADFPASEGAISLYYPGTPFREEAQTVRVRSGQVVSGINITARLGGRIEGLLLENGQPSQVETRVYALNLDNQETYIGYYWYFSPGSLANTGYEIPGLPPGRYLVGVNPYFAEDDRITSWISPRGFLNDDDARIQSRYYPGASRPDTAKVITLAEGEVRKSVNLSILPGGSIAGKVTDESCQCSPLRYWVAAFQGERLVAWDQAQDRRFHLLGLQPGTYELRLSPYQADDPDAAQESVFQLNPDSLPMAAFFEGSDGFTYPDAVTVNAGETALVEDWCVAWTADGGLKDLPAAIRTETFTRLVFPWVSYNLGSFESGLIVNNLNDHEVEVELTATRTNGTGAKATRTVPGKGLLVEDAATLFAELGSGTGFTVTLEAAAGQLAGWWLTQNRLAASGGAPSLAAAIDLSTPAPRTRGQYGQSVSLGTFPVDSGFASAGIALNLGPRNQDLLFEARDAQGAIVKEWVVADWPPFRPSVQLMQGLAPDAAGDLAVSVRGELYPVSGVCFVFQTRYWEVAMGEGISLDGDEASFPEHLVLPWVSQQSHSFESRLMLRNHGSEPAEVLLSARRGFQNPGSVQITRVIPAHGFIREPVATLFPEMAEGGGFAVWVAAEGRQLTGSWMTHNLAAGSGQSPALGLAVGVDDAGLGGRAGTRLLFGYLPGSGARTAAPVILNTGDTPTAVTMRFYDENGHLLLEDGETLSLLEPGVPFAQVVEKWLPDPPEHLWMEAESTGQPLTGAVFLFDSQFLEPAIANALVLEPKP